MKDKQTRTVWLMALLTLLLLATPLAFQLGRLTEQHRQQSLTAPTAHPTATPEPPTRGPSLSQMEGLQTAYQTAEAELATAVYRNEIFGIEAAFTSLEVAALQGTGTAVSVLATRQTSILSQAEATIAAYEGNPFTPTPVPPLNIIATVLRPAVPPTIEG